MIRAQVPCASRLSAHFAFALPESVVVLSCVIYLTPFSICNHIWSAKQDDPILDGMFEDESGLVSIQC